jgi:hypothetical protein
MYWTITPLQSAWHYLSNEWSFIPIGLRTRELRPFYFVGATCPRLISECVMPKDLVVTSCTGLLLYMSEHVLNLDENNSAPIGILEVLMVLISAFITDSWEWFTMPAK